MLRKEVNFNGLLVVAYWLLAQSYTGNCGSWDEWWAYDGISGPDYWGLINPKWSLCNKGKRQSPIDIKPEQLLFDPTLESIQILGNYINGTIENTGRGIVLQIAPDIEPRVVVNKGPLSYNYTLDHLVIHYGHDNGVGSEHTIDGVHFPAEIQLHSFNSQLYGNWSEAYQKPHGIAAIAILMQLSNYEHPHENQQLKQIVASLRNLSSKGQKQTISSLSIINLMPSSLKYYITYEGSLTQPACSENVDWIVINRPVYLSSHQMSLIRNSLNGLGDNFRPTQAVFRRCLRTNINFEEDGAKSRGQKKTCSMNKFTAYESIQRLEDKNY